VLAAIARRVGAARRSVLDVRDRDDIGDDTFHRLEEELDWVEMGVGTERR
jgi:monovalent cation/hydrogen antiporter